MKYNASSFNSNWVWLTLFYWGPLVKTPNAYPLALHTTHGIIPFTETRQYIQIESFDCLYDSILESIQRFWSIIVTVSNDSFVTQYGARLEGFQWNTRVTCRFILISWNKRAKRPHKWIWDEVFHHAFRNVCDDTISRFSMTRRLGSTDLALEHLHFRGRWISWSIGSQNLMLILVFSFSRVSRSHKTFWHQWNPFHLVSFSRLLLNFYPISSIL